MTSAERHVIIGTSVPRVDAVDKVTGAAKYTGDLEIPGMAFGAVVRSPVPHARIVRIDAGRAAAMPGGCVVTGDDLAGLDPYHGIAIQDQPVLAIGKVRYEGGAGGRKRGPAVCAHLPDRSRGDGDQPGPQQL